MSATGEQERDTFDTALQAGLAALGVELSADRREVLFRHYQLVVEANRQFNLTRITGPAEAAIKHYVDSLSLLAAPWSPREVRQFRVLDVGTGAGFPGVPLAEAWPEAYVVAIDGTGKKVRFVERAAEELGLVNLEAVHARAADLDPVVYERFDLIVVRAVGKMDKVLGDVERLIGSRGAVVFYKTPHIDEAERQAAMARARELRLTVDAFRVDLPLGTELLTRELMCFRR